MEITLNIANITGDYFCIEAEDGQKVYDLIIKALNENKKVSLSFENIEMTTTAFLNTAIGQLYKEYSEDFVKDNIAVKNMDQSGLISLKRVVDTAKLYYKDPEAMERSIKEILDD